MIVGHPVFWEESRMMSFLQDVSDRVEKLHFANDPLKTLETNGRFVVRDDWNLHVDKIISEDIRKYRGYMGASVRDLLRAFRNKVGFYSLNLKLENNCNFLPLRNITTTNSQKKLKKFLVTFQRNSPYIGLRNSLS